MSSTATSEQLKRGRDMPAPRPRKTFRLSARRLALVTVAALAFACAGIYDRDWWKTGRFIESTDGA